MKKILFLWLIIPKISSLCLYGQFSQPISYCNILNSSSISNFNENLNHGCFNFNTNFATAPIINVYINAHITISEQNETPAQLVQRVRNFIDEANKSLDNLQPNFGIPTSRTLWIPRAKIRVKLFSNPAVQPTDLFGGIWIYPFRQGLQGEDPVNWPFQNRYGNNVLDVVFANYQYANNTVIPFTAGRAFLGGTNNANTIWMADLNRHVFNSNLPGADINALLNLIQLSRSFNHELGHMLNLRHAEDCSNECGVATNHESDIDPGSECGSRCPNINRCEGDNPGTVVCGDGNRNCVWSNSALMMSQGWLDNSVTPCQWNVIFNYVRDNAINYFRLCHTANTFTLPTSPQREYRAAQEIISTSTIAAGRDVDYFAPLIRLNANFNVALGAQFLAYPALFNCCPVIGEPLVETDKENTLFLQQPFKIIPNPFGDYIQIDYQIDNDFDKVSLTMTDISGKIIKTVPISSQIKGMYQVEVKTNDLLNGVYFIQYQSNTHSATQKIIKSNKN